MSSLCIPDIGLPFHSAAAADEASVWTIAVLLDTELLLIIKPFSDKLLSSSIGGLGFSVSISTRILDDIVIITKIFTTVRRKSITLSIYAIRMFKDLFASSLYFEYRISSLF